MTDTSVADEERGERSGGAAEHAMEETQPKGEFAVPAPKFKPPPPKFQAPPPPMTAPQSDEQSQPTQQKQQQEQQQQQHVASLGSSAAAAAAAAARAATTGGIAPGQRDRVIAQVTSAMYAKAAVGSGVSDAADGSGSGGGGGAGGGAPAYEPPAWSGVPEGVEYTLEVLKGGAVIENRPLSGQPYHTFGRNPAADFVLEHPSASRLHAVLQFNGDTREAFIYDPGSTHGTFLNKQRIKPKVYVPLAVGHTLRFGTSSRLYALGGPADLMPPEGLSREQRRQLAALEASRRAKAKQEEAAQRAMAAALSGGASWGMDDGPEDFDPNDVDSIDWKAYVAAGNKLNDRQQKLAEKIRSKEWKIQNLKTESDRISGKERQEGGLTQGQATTLARNEQAIDRLSEEVEELEETLKESIRDALLQKKREAEASAAPKRKARPDSDDEGGSDSDDDFFDRTAAGGGAKGKRLKAAGGTAGGAAGSGPAIKAVESAESLYGKRELLLEEQKRLQQDVEEEAKRVSTAASAAPKPAVSTGQGDGAAGAEAGAAAAPDAAAQPVAAAADQAGGAGAVAAPEGEGLDSLDAFMANMDTQIEKDKLASLKKQLADVESQLARVTKLLKIADPDGWLKPGTAAAERAKAAAVAAAAGAEARVKAAAAKAAAAAAKKQKEEEAAKNAFQMDVEEEDVPEGQGAGAGQAAGSGAEQGAADGAAAGGDAATAASARPSVIRSRRPIAPGLAGSGGGGAGSAPATGLIIIRKEGQPQPHESRPGAAKGAVSDTARAAAAALMAEMNAAPSAPAQGSWRQGLPSGEAADEGRGERGGLQPSHRPDKGHGGAAAEAAVSADLELLAAARRRQAELAAAAAEEEAAAAAAAQAQWQPPSGQRGDGRTSLNDKLGY